MFSFISSLLIEHIYFKIENRVSYSKFWLQFPLHQCLIDSCQLLTHSNHTLSSSLLLEYSHQKIVVKWDTIKNNILKAALCYFPFFSASLIKYGPSTFNIIQLFLGYQATDKVWTSLIMPLWTFCSLKRSLISIRNTFSILFFTKSLENPEQFYFYWLDNTYQHSLQIWSF